MEFFNEIIPEKDFIPLANKASETLLHFAAYASDNCKSIKLSKRFYVAFAKESMESVSRCIGCEECTERCPYELPIPEMLKRSYEMYERHRKEHGC